tara:strand:+ start:18309 stop:18761 length:453 start_codon:yes stop_codon:yes gene_type:complete
VKNKIYAISLLLSFLVVLSHELIAHHHHDDLAFDFSTKYEHIDDDDHGHDKDNHHNHDSQKENESSEHNHPFPFHHHVSATNDFNIERTSVLESNSQIRNVALLIFAKLFLVEFSKPPNIEGNLYGEPPFLIPSLSYLEAFALRGPPAIV